MIEVGNIVTLENGQEYLLLEEINKGGISYLYAVRTLEDDTPTEEFLIFEALKDEEGEFLKVVNDKELYDQLIDDFKLVVADKLIDAGLVKDEEVSE